jgi:hypothetical protein
LTVIELFPVLIPKITILISNTLFDNPDCRIDT